MASDEEIKIVITAEDKASGVLDKVGAGSGRLGAALKGLGAIAATAFVAAGTAIIGFGVSSIKAFIESEKQMTVANTALQNAIEEMTGKQLADLNKTLGATGSSFVAVQEAMKESSKAALKLGFDDEAASVAFAKLFQVTQDVTKAQNDLKLAEDLAAFSGRSLEESAAAITKVHAGATRVLKEFGIELADDATAADALDLLQKRVTGSAQEMANTTGGKLNILNESWSNLKEQVGATLAEAITPFIDKLSVWAQDPSTQKQFQEIATKIAAMAAQLGPLVLSLVPALTAGLNIAIPVLQFLTGVVNVLTEGFKIWIQTLKEMIDWIKKIPDEVNRAVASLNQLAAKVPGSGGLGITNRIGDAISGALGIGGRASGGPVSAGTPYMVGEQGPELFVPGRSGSIVPNGVLGGGGITINITGTFLSEDAASQLGDMMINQVKRELRI